MAKKVRLTWMDEGQKFVEECLLIEETDPVYLKTESAPAYVRGEFFNPDISLMEAAAEQDLVLFEDEKSIFGVKSSQILSIEDVEA